MKATEKKQLCPVVESIKVFGNERKMIVIYYLFEGGKGFNELEKLTGLNSKSLSITLKELEKAGLIKRIVVSDRPFRVKYELTEKGLELKNVYKELRKWGSKYVLNRRD
ncbi:winged helix-turn-helix transcriptional regulator [Stygiolobus caldivivus]|uniref:Transcriptional regulator n=1 Tax=Stygiolobus caldivivus TaxID=2824673 RepID=A0A8D5U8N5_9CREN|nr:helix-turn-helix domain-containing protein [Stygiolobus caldivivus]BCU71075.1 transcriptional regulator [Stygiolobus caldivivus]